MLINVTFNWTVVILEIEGASQFTRKHQDTPLKVKASGLSTKKLTFSLNKMQLTAVHIPGVF